MLPLESRATLASLSKRLGWMEVCFPFSKKMPSQIRFLMALISPPEPPVESSFPLCRQKYIGPINQRLQSCRVRSREQLGNQMRMYRSCFIVAPPNIHDSAPRSKTGSIYKARYEVIMKHPGPLVLKALSFSFLFRLSGLCSPMWWTARWIQINLKETNKNGADKHKPHRFTLWFPCKLIIVLVNFSSFFKITCEGWVNLDEYHNSLDSSDANCVPL